MPKIPPTQNLFFKKGKEITGGGRRYIGEANIKEGGIRWRCERQNGGRRCKAVVKMPPGAWTACGKRGRYSVGTLFPPHNNRQCRGKLKPVNILTKLPATFNEDAQSAKWQDRKSALDSLQQLLSDDPRLCQPQSYTELVNLLKKILENDPEIDGCIASAKCLTKLATGLGKEFACFAASVMPVVFEKFKVKNAVLRDSLIVCADAIGITTNLNSITESLLEAMAKSNPNIKAQMNLFVGRCFIHTKSDSVPRNLLKELVTIHKKHASDPDAEVRESAYMALGSIMKCIGRESANLIFGDVMTDKAMCEKVVACFNKITEEAAAGNGPAQVRMEEIVEAAAAAVGTAVRQTSTTSASAVGSAGSDTTTPYHTVHMQSSIDSSRTPQSAISDTVSTDLATTPTSSVLVQQAGMPTQSQTPIQSQQHQSGAADRSHQQKKMPKRCQFKKRKAEKKLDKSTVEPHRCNICLFQTTVWTRFVKHAEYNHKN